MGANVVMKSSEAKDLLSVAREMNSVVARAFPNPQPNHPSWIVLLNERKLLTAKPAFDHLFTANRISDILKSFEIHQSVDLVLTGEPVYVTVLVLHNAPKKIIRDTGIKATRLAG